jgi:hypothetical protein
MTRFWISWVEPGTDPRPVKVPPPKAVVAWWCTGYGNSSDTGDYNTICAVVDAPNEKAAQREVCRRGAWHPSEFRFCEPKAAAWMPPEERFPRKTVA